MQRLNPIPTGLGHVTLIYGLIPPMAGRNRVKEDFLLFPKTSFNWKTTSLTHTALFLNLSMIVIFSLSRLSRVMFRYIKGFFFTFLSYLSGDLRPWGTIAGKVSWSADEYEVDVESKESSPIAWSWLKSQLWSNFLVYSLVESQIVS